MMKIRAIISCLKNATFHEDGMTTVHVADFLHDPRFLSAYQKGNATGSWHGCKLRWRVYNCCWAAEQALRISGDFVECGVNRGGISRAIIDYVDFSSISDRRFFLLDTFCSDPGVAWPNQHDYTECYADVVKTFSPFGQIRIIRGRVPDTLVQVEAEKVAFLSIDMNAAEPGVAAMRYFWPKMSAGALAVLDDYAYSDYYRAEKDGFDALSQELGFSILTMPTGQGLIIKA